MLAHRGLGPGAAGWWGAGGGRVLPVLLAVRGAACDAGWGGVDGLPPSDARRWINCCNFVVLNHDGFTI